MTVGQDVRVGVIDGPRGTGRVTRVDEAGVELACTLEATPPPEPDVDLLLALPRPKVMRRLWAQLAAMGVGRIILTNAARVERNYFDTHVLDRGELPALLVEGLQQAQDTRLPRVSIHRRFRPLDRGRPRRAVSRRGRGSWRTRPRAPRRSPGPPAPPGC